MTIEKILEYVAMTPYNTNLKVLEGMLKQLVENLTPKETTEEAQG